MSDSEASPKDNRHLARVLAVQYVFAKLKANKEVGYVPFEVETLLQLMDQAKFDKKLYSKIVDGVEFGLKEIDTLIEKTAPERPLEGIHTVNLAILRCAIWEGFIGKITPPKVVINEYIEICKELNSEEDSSFINGVLGTIKEQENETVS